MTKRILTIIFAIVIAAIPALAGIVDFASLSGTPLDGTDLTTTSVPLSGVTFSYDAQGSDTTATIGSTGIFGFAGISGVLGGALDLNFATPALGLMFTYSVYNRAGAVFNDVFGIFTPSSDSLEDFTGTFRYGSLASSSTVVTPFSLTSLYFGDGINGQVFTVDSVEFDSTVPEPGTVALLACGLLGLCGRKLLRKRS